MEQKKNIIGTWQTEKQSRRPFRIRIGFARSKNMLAAIKQVEQASI